jgi:hypothetical protein
MVIGDPLSGDKAAGTWSWRHLQLICRSRKVELYLHSLVCRHGPPIKHRDNFISRYLLFFYKTIYACYVLNSPKRLNSVRLYAVDLICQVAVGGFANERRWHEAIIYPRVECRKGSELHTDIFLNEIKSWAFLGAAGTWLGRLSDEFSSQSPQTFSLFRVQCSED